MAVIIIGFICFYILYKAWNSPIPPAPVSAQGKNQQFAPTLNQIGPDKHEVMILGYQAGYAVKRGDEWFGVSKAGATKSKASSAYEAAELMIKEFETHRPGAKPVQ